MQNSISYWQHFLLQETEEKELSPKQRKIAKLDPPADEIDAGDFAALRAGAKIEEKVDMDELEFELKRLKKENPGKKITYGFIQDSPKGYVFYIDGKLVKKDKTDDAIDRSELNMLKKLTPTKEIKAKIDALKAKLGVNDEATNENKDYFLGLKVGDIVKFKDSSDRSVAKVKYSVDPNTTFKITTLHHGHPEVPNPNTHADLKDEYGKEVKKVYTGYLTKNIEESQDHEVSMANNSLETIIKHAMDLKSKLGSEEKDIPAWIQDHITNAANFISQAAENYHEYEEDHDEMELASLKDLEALEECWDCEREEDTLPSLEDMMRELVGLDKDGYTQNAQAVGPFRGASRDMQMSGNLESKKRK